jgi:pimeloyl-ACP methyl ester carboxylesterase
MTEFFDIEGGRIAYDVAGSGPLIVLQHGLGDHRQAYRFVVPELVRAGFRVANADMRGHGESSLGAWKAISRTDVAGDLAALIRHLGGGPAVVVGHSLAGGSATIVAAKSPELVSGIVEIGPFTRKVEYSLGGLFRVRRYRQGTFRMTGLIVLRSLGMWMSYLDVAYPSKPADYVEYMARLRLKTLKTSPADAAAELARVAGPALVIMGDEDPDFPDPRAEADAIVAAMPAGVATAAMIRGGGHYPHAQNADQVAALITSFVRERVAA